MRTYSKTFKQDYDYWVEQRKATIQINKRKKALAGELKSQGLNMFKSDQDPNVDELRIALEGESDEI